jgi:hypothetical protein
MATGRTVTRSKNTLKTRPERLQFSSIKPTVKAIKIGKDSSGNEEDHPTASSIEGQLAQAKSSRTQAESARQKIANEILEATKEVCQKLIADGEQTLERAKKLEAEALRKEREAHEERERGQGYRQDAQSYSERVKADAQKKAQEQLDQAQSIRSEADLYRERVLTEVQQEAQEQMSQSGAVKADSDSYRERVIAEAKKQAQEILYLSRSAAEQECNELKHHANLEAQRTMAEVQLVKAAVMEELEAQRIYAEAARLETESLGVLAQVRAKLADPNGFYGNGSDMEIPIVQLNVARHSRASGKTPVPAVKPGSVRTSAVKPRLVTPGSIKPSPVKPNSAEPRTVAKKTAAPARSRRSNSRAK